jgi:hypothetical protein
MFNSFIVSHYIKKFQNNTWYEINDLRQLPIVVPTVTAGKRIRKLVDTAVSLKRLQFANQEPGNELAVAVRRLSSELLAGAPAYLWPGAQMQLLATTDDCLAVVELAVNWEAEKLYGVEGLGPFAEF